MAETKISLPSAAGSNRSQSIQIANSRKSARQISRDVEGQKATAKTAVLRTVASGGHRVGRKTNAEYGRERKYLTPAEVELLIATAKKRGRYGQRGALAILMCYRHGLRVSELVALRWSQIAWEGTARLTVERRKGSVSGVAQALDKDEVRGLRQLQREQPAGTTHIFQGERGAFDVDWFRRMLRRVGVECGLPLVHPHQLRHGCGYALADKGRDLREIQMQLGHKSISNTVGYVDLRPGRLDRIWD
jgi:type 1 fimbriae regulatory protein FimB/type 1 fimbriae regulatory protein FimE